MAGNNAIHKRLERLERENRKLKVMGAAVLMVVCAVGVLGASSDAVPDQVRARRFVVVGEHGEQLAVLGQDEISKGQVATVLRMSGPDPKRYLSLAFAREKMELRFAEDEHQAVGEWVVAANGMTWLDVLGPVGKEWNRSGVTLRVKPTDDNAKTCGEIKVGCGDGTSVWKSR